MQKNLDYKKFIVDSRLRYFKPHSARIEKSFAEEILYSLDSKQKFINSKFFYDSKGSALFEKICKLPEYYPTRTELSLLESLQDDLQKYVKTGCRLVELGSGASVKTKLLLDVLARYDGPLEYFPIDISDILVDSSEQLLATYKKLHVTGIIDTYEGGLEFLKRFDQKKNLVIFLGSSYGNFVPKDGRDFLKTIHNTIKPGDLFLIGLDLTKDKNTLESAYNDSQGVTAEFNLNILSRINNELDADFDVTNFEHVAIYDTKQQRIEMHVKSLVDQTVIISKSGKTISFKKNETIRTEYSYKFSLDQIQKLLKDAEFIILQTWQDEKNYYSLTLASRV